MGLSPGISFAGVNKMRRSLFTILAALVFGVSVYAQTSLSLWPYYVEVTPKQSSPGLYEAVVPLEVMDKARADLADLRLFDAANREVPYAIRIRREVDQKYQIDTRLFNYAVAGSGISEVSVDLGNNPGEHNEVEIDTDGSNFRRQVEVQGSDSGSEWRTLTSDGMLFSFSSQNSAAESARVQYPASRYRYLRLRVQRDPVVDEEAPRIAGRKVWMTVREKGVWSSWQVEVPSYQLLRNQGAHASVWTIDLGARAPCDRLRLQFDETSFSRPFQVEAIDDPENVRLIATGELRRHVGDDPRRPLEITFNEDQIVRKIRLQITDYSNPTLNILSIEASAPARQLLFELKEPAVRPLRLFFGNSKVVAPHYDFEKQLPARITETPVQSALSEVIGNREYQPEPLPLTERAPWLIYIVLTASSIALGFVLFSLARTATRLGTQPSSD